MKKLFITLLTILLVLELGCARTVTQIVSYGDQLVVEVTLRGSFDMDANRYFMVFGNDGSFKVPLPRPDNIAYEFLEPGMQPQQGSITDYYTNYYSTWKGYVILDPGGYFSVAGPFVQGQAISREVIAAIGEVNNKIKFILPLNRIYGSSVVSTVYFDFVTVSWPTGNQKWDEDHLVSTNSYIATLEGSTVTITDDPNPELKASLDILSCTVLVQ